MTEVTLLAEVTFSPTESYQMRFPLTQPIRLSLWPATTPRSVPAVFLIREAVHAGVACVLRIDTVLVPGLEAVMQPGAAIVFGTLPARIVGQGRILAVEPVERGPAVWVTPKTLNGPI